MTDKTNEVAIREAFEDAIIKGLKPQPLVTKDGPVKDPVSGELLTGPPEASFLSVVRAYLKDLAGGGDPKTPQTGKPREGGLLDQFMQTKGKGLPFGRPQ